MNITDQTRAELVSLFQERPIVATELGFLAEEDFISLMQSIHRKLKQQSLLSLASIGGPRRSNAPKKSYQDILDLVRKASKHGL